MNKISSLAALPYTVAYLRRIGAEPRSLRTAVVKEMIGKYWKDIAVIHFERDGTVKVGDVQWEPTEDEAARIRIEFSGVKWPDVKKIYSIIDPPDMIRKAEPKDIFEFRDEQDMIVMIQVRIVTESGKSYIPWTYWDDEEWRCAEPEGGLPLFNLNKLKQSTTVFIHEGAKAARAMQEMSEGLTINARDRAKFHPWSSEMMGAVHVGWIGGALSPARTDWRPLAKEGVKRVYVVADNDTPGISAVPAIAQRIRLPTFLIQFTNEFPPSFDLADEFPDNMFSTMDGVRYYTGPAFRDCLHPATWATDLVANPRGKPTPILRESFKGMWAYIEEADVFVCTEMPEIIRSEAILNKMLAPFSHAAETTKLIVRAYRGRSARICYRPDEKGLTVTFRGSSAINLHVPSVIRTKAGDCEPWLDFLQYMFVKESERRQVERWCATIIARPEVRIGYGLLLVSERQGIGKTTLGSSILAPLVGHSNVGFPGENDIMSPFNDWMAHKRLVVIGEIYSGSSWKAYHSLKSVITDKDITVNQKYMRPYTIENWCHIIASSNSMRALKMENDDRRWFYPEITEVPWPAAKFISLRSWLERGGLSIIRQWAESYGNFIRTAERAPMTERKIELIEGSRSEAQREVAAFAEAIKDDDRPISILLKEAVGWVRTVVQGKVFDSDYELKRAMAECGMEVWEERVKISGNMHYVLYNRKMKAILETITDKGEKVARMRESIKRVGELYNEGM